MNKSLVILAALSLPLGACASTNGTNDTLASAGAGAAVGAAGGAGVAAIAGGDLLTGAAIGAAVGGLAGAVWADQNHDGRADGYVYNGQYYAGAPAGYVAAKDCRNVANTALTTGAAGAALGAGVGAVTGGLSVLAGAAIGAAVGGLGGAIWADANNDGCVDGYIREGQYYQGAPTTQTTPTSYTSGERG
jgi:hypothetical protein